MIYFFADNHYGVHPGKVIYEHLPVELKEKITFFNDEWEPLEHSDWNRDCELLILNMIGATCDQPHPGADAENAFQGLSPAAAVQSGQAQNLAPVGLKTHVPKLIIHTRQMLHFQ